MEKFNRWFKNTFIDKGGYMSIVKELWDDNRTQRIEDTVNRHVDNMNNDKLLEELKTNLKDYYLNVASYEEVEQFIKDNEYLPF